MSWVKRAFCDCGESFEAWRGSLFFVHEDCCHNCGADRSTFQIKTARWVPAKRTAMWPFGSEVSPGHWEFQV